MLLLRLALFEIDLSKAHIYGEKLRLCSGNARYQHWFCVLLCESGGHLSCGDHADSFYRRHVTHVAVAQAIRTLGGSPDGKGPRPWSAWS